VSILLAERGKAMMIITGLRVREKGATGGPRGTTVQHLCSGFRNTEVVGSIAITSTNCHDMFGMNIIT
jgi:hypothetical protein